MKGGEEMKKLLVVLMLLAPSMAMAQGDPFGQNSLINLSTAGESKDIFVVITSITNIILTFLGAIATLLFLYGGFKWFTSQGNSEQIEAAKKIMGAAVVGLAIIFASWAATQYIFDQLRTQLL
jgi:TRAP-type C4-dicarboxylate transport system permease small subunit